ncbi:hypothetical protein L1887_34942 [Cichorium endivia]|nr:hypothetical protein L1887_34942 [Cichorium endivia]
MTHRTNILEDKVTSRDEVPVTIPNGETVPVEGKGSHTLSNGIKVKGVLHVPKFNCNLLSVSKLSKDLECVISFFPDFLIMQGLSSKSLIGAGNCEGGLYRLKMVEKKRKAMMAVVGLWHKRLGHAGEEKFRGVWVFLLKHKHEASVCLADFCKMVETQFEKKVKRIRSDNGGEFVSNQMMNFYAEHGIMLETTCPHTPQQNGVAKRKHTHLLETARALRIGGHLPTRFWGECVLTAAYVINRLPSKIIENKTPFELLYGQKPKYDHMRVLGCLTYYRNTDTKGDKLEPRGKPGIFVGYPHGTKGYKIYDPKQNKIIVSRDVRFA